MAIQIIKRELNPLSSMNSIGTIFWRLPVLTLKQEVAEITLGAILFLYFIKLYYRILLKLAPIIQHFNPRAFRQLHFRLSFFFYEKIVPPPGYLLRRALKIYRKM